MRQLRNTYNKFDIKYFDYKNLKFVEETLDLPVNPNTKEPILLLPKRWLRFIPWINFEDYYKKYIEISERITKGKKVPRAELLELNRNNYDQIETYIKRKQLEQKDCKKDPLFSQIPVLIEKKVKHHKKTPYRKNRQCRPRV